VALKPEERVIFASEGEETRHVNDAWFLNLRYAAVEPRVTIDAPEHIAYGVMYGFSRQAGAAMNIGRNTWVLPATLLPGQVIQVRWWRTTAESAGDSQGGEPGRCARRPAHKRAWLGW
jgi:hypothetical protein